MTSSPVHQVLFFAALPATEIDALAASLHQTTYPARMVGFAAFVAV